ncbi:hypothetical protein MMC30_007845 [Trapelia coarctata]|nr:hypothetical protein [Trapelia coarctata]
MVARGTRQRIASESKDKSVDVGPEIDVPGIATATATLTLERGQAQTIGHGGASDFVFAVRLAKASKNLLQTVLQRDWSLDESYTKKATFDTATGKVDIGAVVEREGLANYHVLEGDDLDFALVAISDEVETEGELEPKSEQHYEPTQGGKAKDG